MAPKRWSLYRLRPKSIRYDVNFVWFIILSRWGADHTFVIAFKFCDGFRVSKVRVMMSRKEAFAFAPQNKESGLLKNWRHLIMSISGSYDIFYSWSVCNGKLLGAWGNDVKPSNRPFQLVEPLQLQPTQSLSIPSFFASFCSFRSKRLVIRSQFKKSGRQCFCLFSISLCRCSASSRRWRPAESREN